MVIVLTQTFVNKGLKLFGGKSYKVVNTEFTQIDKLGVLVPKCFSELSEEERNDALPAIVFIKEKRDGRIKGRACADGRKQRLYTSPEE